MRGTTVNRTLLTRTLQLDGVANAAAGVALVAAAGWLSSPTGVAALPLRIVGLLLIAYGIENLLVARRPTRGRLAGLAAVDLVFAAIALAAAVLDPTGATTMVRWTVAVVADLSLVMGVVKLVGLRRFREGPATHPARRAGTRPAR